MNEEPLDFLGIPRLRRWEDVNEQMPLPIQVKTTPKPMMTNTLPQRLVTSPPKPIITPKSPVINQTRQPTNPPTDPQKLEKVTQLGVFYGQKSIPKTPVESSLKQEENLVVSQNKELKEKDTSVLVSSVSGLTLSIGNTVTATTMLPILFDNRRQQKVLLKTNASLGNLAKDTYLIANVSHQNGALTAFVTGYIVNDEVKSIPDESIIIVAENRMPLMAQQHQPNQDVSFNRLLLKGLGKALEYDNLPDFSSVTTNGNSTIKYHYSNF